MDETRTRPELSRAELPPSREEQIATATTSRKRQLDSDIDDEPLVERARLTRKNLAIFDKMGKRKSSDPTDGSGSTGTMSTTLPGFAIQAYRNGIRGPTNSKPPTNLEEIQERHRQSRASPSPPEPEYKRYVSKVQRAKNEATLVVKTSGHILKEYDDEGYSQVFNQSFTAFPDNVGFNDGLPVPRPDYIEGLGMEKYNPFPVDRHVDGAVLYKYDPFSLTLPHLAGEYKGRNGNMEIARLQSAYDGAALVYARNQALSYMGKSDPPGHAEITTFTTDGTNLNFYAHYATPSADDENALEYHQYLYATAEVKFTHQGHKDGRKGLRNAQDHAKEQSTDISVQPATLSVYGHPLTPCALRDARGNVSVHKI
ncbi:hypothetical protein F5883DRAFT_688640 [Diaporthe sp. PMI_573]|nr:hypothetical protein F5883DRAFT_688640 [Diaporthaceae sp. PMI_573]